MQGEVPWRETIEATDADTLVISFKITGSGMNGGYFGGQLTVTDVSTPISIGKGDS